MTLLIVLFLCAIDLLGLYFAIAGLWFLVSGFRKAIQLESYERFGKAIICVILSDMFGHLRHLIQF